MIDDVCLAIKKRGFGVSKWNGVGGKVMENETPEEAIVREAQEEIGVVLSDFYKVAVLNFMFKKHPEWEQQVDVFICEEWLGDPAESEEMKPAWFQVDKIPYDQMWVDDQYWMPRVFTGENLKGEFWFEGDDKLVKKEIQILTGLD